MLDKELVVVTLTCLLPIWETFITIISNNNVLLTFGEIVGNLTQEESMIIASGRIQKNEEGQPDAYITHDRRKKEKEGPSRKPLVGNTEREGETIFLFNCYFYQLYHLYLEHKINNKHTCFY